MIKKIFLITGIIMGIARAEVIDYSCDGDRTDNGKPRITLDVHPLVNSRTVDAVVVVNRKGKEVAYPTTQRSSEQRIELPEKFRKTLSQSGSFVYAVEDVFYSSSKNGGLELFIQVTHQMGAETIVHGAMQLGDKLIALDCTKYESRD